MLQHDFPNSVVGESRMMRVYSPMGHSQDQQMNPILVSSCSQVSHLLMLTLLRFFWLA
jgi:hypothetical protein